MTEQERLEAEREDVHLPSDEHYEDPEFVKGNGDVGDEVDYDDEGEENVDNTSNGTNSSRKQGDEYEGLQTDKIEESPQIVYPDTPLVDTAEQAESHEESTCHKDDTIEGDSNAAAREQSLFRYNDVD